MKRIALIVEGQGDINSVASMISKTASVFDIQMVCSQPVIRAGEAKKLRRVGELERYLLLASSRDSIDEIFVVVDLDDGCAKDYYEDFIGRANNISAALRKPVQICFCVREYEAWLLSDIENIASQLPEYNITVPEEAILNSPERHRGAKEIIRSACKGRNYKETRDQTVLTKKACVRNIYLKSRSFRKLAKCITGMNYAEIDGHAAILNPAPA